MADLLPILLGLTAMLAMGISNAMSKKPANELGSRRTIFFRGLVICALWALIIPFLLDRSFFPPLYIAIAIGIAALFGYVPLMLYYTSLTKGKIGVVSPIANSSGMFTILLAALFFGERLGGLQLIAIAAIVAGIILVSMKPEDLRAFKFGAEGGIGYALVAAVLWGVLYFLLKIPVLALGAALPAMILEFVTMISSGVHMKISGDSFSVPGREMFPYLAAMAVTGVVGVFSYNTGISTYGVSIVAALAFSCPVVSTIYGRIVYGEKLTVLQYAATALTVLGVVGLAVG
jgi:drug/metabolite transporter (DMT)-like permease